MPLNLHPNCKKRLTDVLVEALSDIHVENNMFLQQGGRAGLYKADQVLPATGKVRECLERYVNEFPVVEFVTDVLTDELYQLGKYNSDLPVRPLTDIEGYGDPRATAERLVDLLDSLPWRYALTLELVGLSALPIQGIVDLSPTVRIVRPDESFLARYPLRIDDEARRRRIHGTGLGVPRWR